MNQLSIESLETSKRDLSVEHTNLRVRVHRAISWLKRAEQEEDRNSRFVFLWIGFNALFLRIEKNQRDGSIKSEQFILGKFFETLIGTDRDHCIRKIYQQQFDPGNISPETDMHPYLEKLFLRIRGVRNQLLHGTLVWDSEIEQISDGVEIMGRSLPAFIDLMIRNPGRDWGRTLYFIPPPEEEPVDETNDRFSTDTREFFPHQPSAETLENLRLELDGRDELPRPLSCRLERAIKWLRRAEQETDDLFACFIFLWISFSAAYDRLAENFFKNSTDQDRNKLKQYFRTLVEVDSEHLIFYAVWDKFYPRHERHLTLLENRYVYAPFWGQEHGLTKREWLPRMTKDNRVYRQARSNMNTSLFLAIIFERLYTLRNQLMHGGATWNSGLAWEQVSDGTKLMAWILPVFIDLMMRRPDEDWGKPNQPRIRKKPLLPL